MQSIHLPCPDSNCLCKNQKKLHSVIDRKFLKNEQTERVLKRAPRVTKTGKTVTNKKVLIELSTSNLNRKDKNTNGGEGG